MNNDRAPGRRNAAQGIDSRGARGPIARTYRSRTLRLPHTVTTPAIGATGHPAFACCVTKRTPWRLTTGPMTSTRRWHSRPYKVALTAVQGGTHGRTRWHSRPNQDKHISTRSTPQSNHDGYIASTDPRTTRKSGAQSDSTCPSGQLGGSNEQLRIGRGPMQAQCPRREDRSMPHISIKSPRHSQGGLVRDPKSAV